MSNTSHELKTPLTVIRTNAELLHDEIGENKHLQYIQQETDRMISMVNQMLTLMRLDGHEASRNCYSYRVDEAREETGNHFGLGLSIAGSIVANHHGKITVESKNGSNIFRVNLPVTSR